MNPLTIDDLIPLDEYCADRAEHLQAAARYLDRYRRVRIGPRLTLVFENRQTLSFRVHEFLRTARLSEPSLVQAELDRFNLLLPGPGQWHAALHIDLAEGAEHPSDHWRDLPDGTLAVRTSAGDCPARFITNRAEDRAWGVDHWIEFSPDAVIRTALADRRQTALIVIEHCDYRHQAELSDTLRRSLLDDLSLCERSAA